MPDSPAVYVTNQASIRRLRPSVKADRLLTLGLTIPALAFLGTSVRKILWLGFPSIWQDYSRLVPFATAGLGVLFLGLAFALWLKRTRVRAGDPRTWLREFPPAYPEPDSSQVKVDSETPAA